MTEQQWMQLTALLMVAVLVVPGALRAAHGRIALYGALWLAIMVALVYGYQAYMGP